MIYFLLSIILSAIFFQTLVKNLKHQLNVLNFITEKQFYLKFKNDNNDATAYYSADKFKSGISIDKNSASANWSYTKKYRDYPLKLNTYKQQTIITQIRMVESEDMLLFRN